jgi:uncharacterized membrane-anchored protein YhcB (DUF1043 family)
MKYIGGLVLINVVLIAAYFLFLTQVSGKRIFAFASIGLIIGVCLMLADRITKVKVPGIGEITAAVEKVTTDANEVEKIRKEVESHRDAIALVLRDTNTARKDLDELASLSKKSKEKADQVENVLSEAKTSLDDIKSVSDFALLITKASNDDRSSFDALRKIAGIEGHRFIEITQPVLMQIITDPQVTGIFSFNINWKRDYNLEPDKASFSDFANVFNKVTSIHQPAVLKTMWKQARFPKNNKLDVLYQVITSTKSIRCLHLACKLMDEEAKLGMNIIVYEQYAKWWEENKESYSKNLKSQPTDSPEKE